MVEANVRLLVVDDDVDTVETTALLFQLEGYETRTAEDGAEAIELAKAFHPDVVLLDLGVPEMNGYEVARELRRIDTTKNSLIVAVTGFAQPIDELRSVEADFDLHLVKPVDFAVIERLFRLVEVVWPCKWSDNWEKLLPTQLQRQRRREQFFSKHLRSSSRKQR